MIEEGIVLRVQGGEQGTSYLDVAGMRLTSLIINNGSVDVTHGAGDGWRLLLSEAGQRTVSVTGAGLSLGSAGEKRLRDLALTGAKGGMELRVEDGRALTGAFVVASLHYQGRHDDELTYEVSLESAGKIVLT